MFVSYSGPATPPRALIGTEPQTFADSNRSSTTPPHTAIAAHWRALRQLLEDLAKPAGAYDTAVLAAQLQVLIDGAIADAAVDGQPAAARSARELAQAAVKTATAA
jgi:hypothetical protein